MSLLCQEAFERSRPDGREGAVKVPKDEPKEPKVSKKAKRLRSEEVKKAQAESKEIARYPHDEETSVLDI